MLTPWTSTHILLALGLLCSQSYFGSADQQVKTTIQEEVPWNKPQVEEFFATHKVYFADHVTWSKDWPDQSVIVTDDGVEIWFKSSGKTFNQSEYKTSQAIVDAKLILSKKLVNSLINESTAPSGLQKIIRNTTNNFTKYESKNGANFEFRAKTSESGAELVPLKQLSGRITIGMRAPWGSIFGSKPYIVIDCPFSFEYNNKTKIINPLSSKKLVVFTQKISKKFSWALWDQISTQFTEFADQSDLTTSAGEFNPQSGEYEQRTRQFRYVTTFAPKTKQDPKPVILVTYDQKSAF